jgi:hypothetical protein
MESTLRPIHAALQQALGGRLAKFPDLGVSPAVLALCLIAALLVLEQLSYMYKRWKLGLTGPLFVVPLIGGIVEMGEWDAAALWSLRGGCSTSAARGGACHAANDLRAHGCVRDGGRMIRLGAALGPRVLVFDVTASKMFRVPMRRDLAVTTSRDRPMLRPPCASCLRLDPMAVQAVSRAPPLEEC